MLGITACITPQYIAKWTIAPLTVDSHELAVFNHIYNTIELYSSSNNNFQWIAMNFSKVPCYFSEDSYVTSLCYKHGITSGQQCLLQV